MNDNSSVNVDAVTSNFIRGFAIWALVILLTGFGAAIMSSTAGEIATALSTVIAAIIGGGFVMGAALLAWRSVQMQIGAQDRTEKQKQEQISRTLKTALTAELLAFSSSLIDATSIWNLRARENSQGVPTDWPTLMKPRVYDALLPETGLLDGWVAAAIISFYGSLFDLNEMSVEAMNGRQTKGENFGTIARRFQSMARYLADSLDGLNDDHQFPITRQDVTALRLPNGQNINYMFKPKTLQSLLYTLAGDELVYFRRQQEREAAKGGGKSR
jgi:hypothetical protein